MTNPEDLSSSEIQAFITKVKSLPGGTNIQQDEAEKAAHLYLRARKRDVERAVELYKANKRMRYTENVDSIDPLEDGVRRELLSGKFTVLPAVCDDEIDATVAIFTAYRHWPPLTTHRDTLKGVLYQLDAAMMDEQSQKKGLIVLYDMRDTKYSNFDYHLCIKLLNLFKGVYPARLRKVIIIEPPFWFRAPFNVLRLFVREKMRDRIYSVGYDELNIHLPNTTLTRLFSQLNSNQHFDWLLNCLKRTGHISHIPNDYFTPPSLSSIYQHNPLLGNEFIVQLNLYHNDDDNNNNDMNMNTNNNVITLPRHNNTTNTNIHLSSIHGSLRYPVKHRRCSDDSSMITIETTPSSVVVGEGEEEVVVERETIPITRLHNYLMNENISSVNNLQTSTLPCRSLLTSTTINNVFINKLNNRMTDSMFQSFNRRIFYQSDHHFSQFTLPKTKNNHGNNSGGGGGGSSITSTNFTDCNSLKNRLYITNPLSQTRLSISEFINRVQSVGSTGTCTRFAQASNKRRNRYLDVPCLDATAVELSDNTYIHANWVDGYRCPRAYILAQGPLENTTREFWMTIWEHRVVTIIMLTKIIEGQRPKCALYWPTRNPLKTQNSRHSHHINNTSLQSMMIPKDLDSKLVSETIPISANYGEFQVVNCGEFIEADGLYRRSVLEVTCKSSTTIVNSMESNRQKSKSDIPINSKNSSVISVNPLVESNKKLEVYHYLYLGWPDFDVPVDSESFLKFLFTVKQSHKTRSSRNLSASLSSSSILVNHMNDKSNSISPLLVHCSAGIGRTGTFVTTDICLQQANNEGYLDVPAVVSQLRCQRAGAVQVGKQYAFIHQALVSQLSKGKQVNTNHSNNNDNNDKREGESTICYTLYHIMLPDHLNNNNEM
ncbi:unnamed protein product [Heterobilharzia americana]|nr:unnamed protein product [Heterobilharzia americana]